MTRLLLVTTLHTTLTAFLRPLAAHFRAHGWQVDAMASGVSACDECKKAFDQVWEVPWSRKPLRWQNFLSAPSAVREVVTRERYELVHVHTPVAAFVTRFALRDLRTQHRVKVIYTAHGFHFYRGGPMLRNRLFLDLERLGGHWTDYLIVINREDEAAAHEHRIVPPDRVRYMPGIGVDTEQYQPDAVSEEDRLGVRKALGIGDGNPLLVKVAAFNPGKRHRDVLAALAWLDRPEVHLALAGRGPLLESMQRLAKKLGVADQVHFLGFRTDIPALLRAAQASVLASEREGLPRTIMESLSLEVPVIGTDIRGIRDLLDGGCGLLVPKGDVKSLARAMSWIIDHPKEASAMGRRGRQNMRGVFELQNIVSMHDTLYEEALERHDWSS